MSVDDPRLTDQAKELSEQSSSAGAAGRNSDAGSHDTSRGLDPEPDDNVVALDPPRAPLSPAAKRALAEAEERRQQAEKEAEERAKEVGGRDGPDPVRYGDWEKGGICWDF